MSRSEVFNREEVLEKVRDLFWDKGFNGTSMSDLVEVTGLNRSSIYNSFGNKMALYKTVLIQYQDETQDIFQDALKRANNPKEAVHFIFENYINEILRDLDRKGCFSLNSRAELARSNESIKDYLVKMQNNQLDFFEGLLQEGQDAHFINRDQSAAHYAQYLLNAIQGLKMTGMFLRDRNKLENIIYNTLKILE